MCKNVEPRAQKWVLSSEFIVFSHVFADPVGNRLNFIFFPTFHAVCLCRAYPGSWKRGPHWSDATVHAIGISTMRFLWFSLWIAGYMLRQRTWRYHTHPTPPQPHPTCRRVSNVASVAVHVCCKCIYMNVAQRSRSYNTPAYMTLSHPPHPTPPQPHTQGQRWWKECWKNEESVALLEALTPKT